MAITLLAPKPIKAINNTVSVCLKLFVANSAKPQTTLGPNSFGRWLEDRCAVEWIGSLEFRVGYIASGLNSWLDQSCLHPDRLVEKPCKVLRFHQVQNADGYRGCSRRGAGDGIGWFGIRLYCFGFTRFSYNSPVRPNPPMQCNTKTSPSRKLLRNFTPTCFQNNYLERNVDWPRHIYPDTGG
jgi:hypothetical protein